MKISFVEIQNFRKLKSCHIDISEKTTLFVGANNSGKTSAMEALIRFLKKRGEFSFTDITISNWNDIETIGNAWTPGSKCPQDLSGWETVLPSLDIWFSVQSNELQYVSHILPTLKWNGGLLGVRLRLEPKAIQELFQDYTQAIEDANKLKASAAGVKIRSLPDNLREFLEVDGRISTYFQVVSYLLDPTKITSPVNSLAQPQTLSSTAISYPNDILKGLIKIDIINAQRGFSDANADDSLDNSGTARSLSSQLKLYYNNHINPMDTPDAGDLQAIQSIEKAQDDFDKRLLNDFNNAFSELQNLGYPGFSDPKIHLSSKIHPMESLNHATAIQYDVIQGGSSILRLPEKYNGLGYQNLVSMVFKLIRFRDEWMRIGKLSKRPSGDASSFLEPLHLVLIEEPEAHLHAQVQQVFINKSFAVLRNNKLLGDKADFTTQMVVSTHSSHIAHECEFSDLRYFQRIPAESAGEVPKVQVVNLSTVFGTPDESTKFAVRYLKTTHCDLFFADAAILVEGPAEKILLPGLIKKHFPALTSRYITILEINGSHAHRLEPLINSLGLLTLVITDLDSVDPNKNSKATQPVPNVGFETGNTTLKSWIPKNTKIDELYAVKPQEKINASGKVRVAYQTPINFKPDPVVNAYPYTFEDAVIFENIETIKLMSATRGLLKKAIELSKSNKEISDIGKDLFDTLQSGSNLKAEFALELLFADTTDAVKIPQYIAEGLIWLDGELKGSSYKLATSANGMVL